MARFKKTLEDAGSGKGRKLYKEVELGYGSLTRRCEYALCADNGSIFCFGRCDGEIDYVEFGGPAEVANMN
ncbi:hypothetical protein HK097_005235 [Rhizophlyctis rosea]|uniref:Uncharacterized protein n=1 Tax=Rhizophlyctis rosea TaxID=64517 RepID=A0AAD5SEF7_9FUNG|nr:hypothetical protein HK097_005235 [Rhizophlyctis rosea]